MLKFNFFTQVCIFISVGFFQGVYFLHRISFLLLITGTSSLSFDQALRRGTHPYILYHFNYNYNYNTLFFCQVPPVKKISSDSKVVVSAAAATDKSRSASRSRQRSSSRSTDHDLSDQDEVMVTSGNSKTPVSPSDKKQTSNGGSGAGSPGTVVHYRIVLRKRFCKKKPS